MRINVSVYISFSTFGWTLIFHSRIVPTVIVGPDLVKLLFIGGCIPSHPHPLLFWQALPLLACIHIKPLHCPANMCILSVWNLIVFRLLAGLSSVSSVGSGEARLLLALLDIAIAFFILTGDSRADATSTLFDSFRRLWWNYVFCLSVIFCLSVTVIVLYSSHNRGTFLIRQCTCVPSVCVKSCITCGHHITLKYSTIPGEEQLVRIPEPVMIIPNLAIHLTTADERKAFGFNNETHLQPIMAMARDTSLVCQEATGNIPFLFVIKVFVFCIFFFELKLDFKFSKVTAFWNFQKALHVALKFDQILFLKIKTT